MTNDDQQARPGSHDELDALNEATRDAWNRHAQFWDEHMGEEGNDFQSLLVNPAAERLMALRPGMEVLDIACGNGLFSRRLSELGARVVACDFSESMIERARARGGEHIEYRVVDATDEGQLLSLGERRFDAAVANMALMDMARIEPLAGALPRILKPGAAFVFTVAHPCFNSTGTSMLREQEYRDGQYRTELSIRVTRYLGLGPAPGIAIVGQPTPQYYFDRPLAVLFGVFLAHGLVLDGLEEPAFSGGDAGPVRRITWTEYREIPQVLAARFRLPQ